MALDDGRFSEAQAARILGYCTKTLQRLRRSGHIGYHRSPGGRIHYTADQLANFAAGMRVDPVFGHTSPPMSP